MKLHTIFTNNIVKSELYNNHIITLILIFNIYLDGGVIIFILFLNCQFLAFFFKKKINYEA